MRRGLIVSICILLTISLCVFFTNEDVKAADGYIKQQYKFFTPNTVSGVSLWQTVPANSSLNQYQSGISDVSARIPSNVWTSGYSISFGIRTPWSTEPTNNAWGTNCTCYFGNPYQYQETDINYYSYSGTSTTYTIKYPCAFINYYPSDVTIPPYYTTLSDGFSRNVVYSKPDFVGNQKCGNILAAVIVPQGKPFLMYCGNTNVDDEYPMDVNTACDVQTFAYYNSLGESGYTPFYFFSVDDTWSQTGWGNIDAGFCTHTDVPVFCDLYDAIYYSVTGTISDTDKVLYGLETAVQVVTPTPTDNPTPTPTANPTPSGTAQITGTVEVTGTVDVTGPVEITGYPLPPYHVIVDALPTPSPTPIPSPTPTPIITLIEPSPPASGTPTGVDGVSSGNGWIDSNIINSIVPKDITPGALIDNTEEGEGADSVSGSLEFSDTILPGAYLGDIVQGDTIFGNLPLEAIDKLKSNQGTDTNSFFTVFLSTLGVFLPLDADGNTSLGGDGVLFWFSAVFVTWVLVTIIKRIVH